MSSATRPACSSKSSRQPSSGGGLGANPGRFGTTSVYRSASGRSGAQADVPLFTLPCTSTTRGPAPHVSTCMEGAYKQALFPHSQYDLACYKLASAVGMLSAHGGDAPLAAPGRCRHGPD